MSHDVTIHQAEQLLRTDVRSAHAHAQAVLDAGTADPASSTYQHWLLVKASAQARMGDTQDGARAIREVKRWAEEHDDRPLQALSHRQLSGLFLRVGDPALMLEHAVSAVDLLEDDAADEVRVDHLLALADALGAGGSFDDAIRRYQEAGRLAERCDDRYLQLAVLNNLAYTQYEAGLPQEAVVTAERLRDEAAAHGQPLGIHDSDTIARAYTGVGRFEEAESVLVPLCAASDTTGESCDGLVMALMTLTEVRRRSGAFDAAQGTLDRATRLAEEYTLTGRSIEALAEQAELYAARGDYQRAFETFRDYHRTDVEMRALERDGRAHTLNAIFEATEARRSSDYFRELSVRDPLTGLHNRRHVDAHLAELLEQVGRGETGLVVGLIDLDHFKRVNDTRSHAVGDEVLRRVAVLLRDAAEEVEGGLASRMGGEEFLVLLPGVDRATGIDLLDRLRRTISEHAWSEISDGVVVTASIGVACAPVDAKERKQLLALADENLYAAKHAGRNRVVG